MKRALLLVAFAFVGCRGKAASPPAAPLPPLPVSEIGLDRATAAAELDRFENDADQYCACHDDACRHQASLALASEEASETHADPLSDDKEWPPDLDAIGKAAVIHLLACGLEQHAPPEWLVLVNRGALERLGDAACKCTDGACAERAGKKLSEYTGEIAGIPEDADTAAAIATATTTISRCIAQTGGEQALLDLKAIRTAGCACHDATCARDVERVFEAWAKDNGHTGGTDDMLRQAKDLGQQLSDCLRAATAGH